MKKRILSLLSVVAVFITGCSANFTDGQVGSEKNSGYDFIFVCPMTDNVYWETCMEGIKKADEELGTTTRVMGEPTSENFVEEIVKHMEEAVDARPDGIMAYSGIDEMYPLIDRACDSGIPVITIDSDAPDTKRAAYVGTDLYSFGYMAGENMVRLTGGKAKIGYICSSESVRTEAEVFNAFTDSICDYDMEIVATNEGWSAAERAERAAETMLSDNPEITAIFCTGGGNVTGAARAKQSLGRDDVVLLGFEDTEENLELVRKGVIDTLLIQSPYQMGYQGVHLLKEYLDTGRLASKTYDTEVITVTKNNVDSYKNGQ